METKGTLRNVARCTVFAGAALLLVGADGCDFIYRYVQCILSGECTEIIPEFFGNWFETLVEDPPPPPPTSDNAAPAAASAGSQFGAAIAAPTSLSGATGAVRLVVGAPYDQTAGGSTGAVYVYSGTFDDTAEPARIVPPDGTSGARFGAAVAVERYGTETIVIVGAPGAAPSGAAYVFEWNGTAWVQTARFSPGGASYFTEFGASVALVHSGSASDLVAVVGEPNRNDGGSVSVYRRSGTSPWAGDSTGGHVASFQPAGVTSDERFGACLASSHEFLAVGAPGRGGYLGAGAAYLFRLDPATGAWTESPTRMEPEDAPAQAAFGTSVAVTTSTGDQTPTVVVGAPGGGYSQLRGTVWSFLRSTDGTLERHVFTSSSGGFGRVVAADPTRPAVVVGSPETSDDFTHAVSLYAPAEFWPRDPDGRPLRGEGRWESVHHFGAAMVVRLEPLSDTPVVDVGAPGEGSTGVVYHFRLPTGVTPGKAPARKPEGNRYMAFRADTDRPGTGTAQFVVDLPLRTPFRAEVAVGSFSSALRKGLVGGSIALRLDRKGSDPQSFALLRTTFLGAGLEVTAETEFGKAPRRVSMPSEWIAELAVECDGSTMRLLARPRGVGEFETVTNMPAGFETYTASIVIEGIAPGSEVGMDEPRVLSNAAPAVGAPPAETALDLIYAAIDREMATSAALDESDLAAALVLADEAKSKLAEAKIAVSLIPAKAKKPAPTGPKVAQRYLTAAARELAKARKLIDRGKTTTPILRKLSKSLAGAGRALAALRG